MPTPSTSPPRSTPPAHLKKYYKCKSKKSIKNKEKLITKLETQIDNIKTKNENKTQKLRKKINKDREMISKMEDNCKKIEKQEDNQIEKIYERIQKLVHKVEDENDKCYKFHPNGKKN